jgi:hypothetical protein
MAVGITRHALDAYLKNARMISFFAIPGLFALALPILMQTPVFNAFGASFLRTGSIPDLTNMDIGIMIFTLLISLYLLSLAIVNINIVIKSQRTGTNIRSEVLKGITGYTLNVFWLFLVGELLLLIIQLVTFEFGVQHWLAPLLSLLVTIPLFFAPTALVIDELRPFRAAEKSIRIFISKFPYIIWWFAIAFVSLVIVHSLFLFILPHGIAPIATMVINALVLMPFLIVLQTQVYLSKYTILA